MRIDIEIDRKGVDQFMKAFPFATLSVLKDFNESVGRVIERNAKSHAPVISGNLRRSIKLWQPSPLEASVVANANYAQYVHGAPFFQNARPRKETPFFTYALVDGATQIQNLARGIIPRIANRL